MKKILLVDDEPEVAELLKLFFEGLGYTADVFFMCSDAEVALETGKYWAVFCDYMMPCATGDRLYDAVRLADKDLAKRFVMMTGALLEEKLDGFFKAEGVRVISKPFGLDKVSEILSAMEASC